MGPVRAPAVDLHDQPLLWPEEINGERAETNVDLRLRQAAASAERQETHLELAACAIRL